MLFTLACFSATSSADELVGWKKITTQNMEVYTDYNDETALELMQDFEIFRNVVMQFVNGVDAENLPSIKVYLFSKNSLWDPARKGSKH